MPPPLRLSCNDLPVAQIDLIEARTAAHSVNLSACGRRLAAAQTGR